MNNIDNYNQFLKCKDRHLAIKHAVEALTQFREESCCVKRNYVRNIYDFLTLTEDDSAVKREAQKINLSHIRQWESLHDSFISTRRPADLTVCYLSGPEPLNDYSEFVNLGILPQNIWALEIDKDTYSTAIGETIIKGYPAPRVIRQNIEGFIEHTPKKFDILYLDACGCIPSKQHVLRCVEKICEYQRIESPGVIISNISEPDEKDHAKYEKLIVNYLFFRKYADVTDTIENLQDKEQYKELLDQYDYDFKLLYGEFISCILRDLPSVMIPMKRMIENDYFKQLLAENEATLKTYSTDQLFAMSKRSSIPQFVYFCEKTDLIQNDEKCKEFFNETVPFEVLLKACKIETLMRNDLLKYPTNMMTSQQLVDERKIFQFLDKPHNNLFIDIAINQLTYPLHYVISQNTRYLYRAKIKWMYTDVNIYDECRYIYEWMPSLNQLKIVHNDPSIQYIFRFALDGLVKQREAYNNEFFYQGAVVSGNRNDEFGIKKLNERINLNNRR